MVDTGEHHGPGSVPETMRLLFELLRRMRHHFEEVIAEFDLSPQQGHALRLLGGHVGPSEHPAMRDIAEHLNCDASNVTGIVDRLEERGLVRREADPDDRRRKHIVLTDEGRELHARVHERLIRDRPGIAGLDPEERDVLRSLLRKSLDHLPG